jgi:hypothetical protein
MYIYIYTKLGFLSFSFRHFLKQWRQMSRLRLRAATSPEDPIPQGTVLLALQGATVGRPNHCLLHIYMGVGQNLLLSILMG